MSTLNGLPAHILLVHAIVVLLPLTALLLVLSVLRPALRRRLSGFNALLAVVVTALVPVTTGAGEWLQARVEDSDAVREHAEQGDTALYVALPVAVLALVVWWRGRESDAVDDRDGTGVGGAGGTATRTRTYLAPTSRAVGTVVTVLAVPASAAAVYDVYLIGDSGARASWEDGFSSTPLPGSPTGG